MVTVQNLNEFKSDITSSRSYRIWCAMHVQHNAGTARPAHHIV